MIRPTFGVVRNGSPFDLSEQITDCYRTLPYAYHTEAKATYNVIVIVNVIAIVIVIVSVIENIKKKVCVIGKGKGKVNQGNPLGKPTLSQHWNFHLFYERSDVLLNMNTLF